jgi:hypothetical protein
MTYTIESKAIQYNKAGRKKTKLVLDLLIVRYFNLCQILRNAMSRSCSLISFIPTNLNL